MTNQKLTFLLLPKSYDIATIIQHESGEEQYTNLVLFLVFGELTKSDNVALFIKAATRCIQLLLTGSSTFLG